MENSSVQSQRSISSISTSNQTVEPHSDFRSTTTYEMENSSVQSQRSISSISTSNQTIEPHSDFRSTTTYEMENRSVQSQRSISPVSTSNQTIEPHSEGSGSDSSEFVNHGFLLWTQSRQQWTGNRNSENQMERFREPKISWNATYESLLGTNKLFQKPIPLSEMVDFLVDIWEQEGMYD